MAGNDTISRRSLFSGLKNRILVGNNQPPNGDPLFEKYARKTLTPRIFSTVDVAAESFRSGIENREGNVTSGLAPYTGSWTDWEKLHLLRRTGYSINKTGLAALSGLSVSASVDLICTVSAVVPDPPVNWYHTGTTPDENGIPYGADWTNDFFTGGSVGQTTNSNRQESTMRWLFGLSINSDISIREKMTWFWYHFIPVDFEDIRNSSNTYINTNSARFCYTYFKLLRSMATGNFKDIITAISVHPAMMIYLNNNKNTSTAPDENFARELMELFTIGKDVSPAYTEADVIAAANALTGWRLNGINTANPTVTFDSTKHSMGTKNFSTFFGTNAQILTTGTGTAAGSTEMAQLIDLIFTKSVIVSQYICRRLYRFFVYYDIDANVEANVIVPLAQTLVNNNWDILPALKQLLKSEHFFDMANRGVMIKSPVDFVIESLRSFQINTNVSVPTNYDAQYKVWNYFNNSVCFPMEQKMGRVPNVSGWVAYYQTPAFYEYWINSNTIQKRSKFINDIANGFNLTYSSLTTRIQIDPIAFAKQWDNATIRDTTNFMNVCVQFLLPVDLDTAQKNIFIQQTLLSGQTNTSYWQTAWDTYIANPNTANTSAVSTRLKNLILTLTQLAEYQLM